MAVPDAPADALEVARAWLENMAERHATGGAADLAPPRVRALGEYPGLGPRPDTP